MSELVALKSAYQLLQDYWLLTVFVLAWFLRHAVQKWVEAKLNVAVTKEAEAIKHQFLAEMEALKLTYSSQLEETKLKIEIRKAAAIEVAKQRIEAYQKIERLLGAAGRSAHIFLTLEPQRRADLMPRTEVITNLHAASEAVSEKQLLVPDEDVKAFHALISDMNDLCAAHEQANTTLTETDAAIDDMAKRVRAFKQRLRELLASVAAEIQ